ncbi:MAG: amino acid--tRNA ligase-related protein, partial [Planctomycetota bacterium]
MGAKDGDMVVLVAGDESTVWRSLGALRLHVAKELNFVPETDGADAGGSGPWNFLWVTRFPMFEWDAEPNDGSDPRWVSLHHPFTAPADWAMEGDPGAMESRAYDLVLNGWELGSGSIRIHRQDTQERVFELLGLSEDEQKLKFGFLLEALSYGPPPHGGFAVGLDRIVALTLGMESIRDVVAFPKTATASDLMCEAPSTVDPHQMKELFIAHEGLPDTPQG